MPKVKIIDVPPGGAPDAIRKQWVGLELPLEKVSEPGILASVTGGKPNPRSVDDWSVNTQAAIQALRDADQEEAAEWWETWYLETGGRGKTLVFARDCCELIDETDEAAEAAAKKRVAAMTANKRT
jgi:hypothetical protein